MLMIADEVSITALIVSIGGVRDQDVRANGGSGGMEFMGANRD